MTEFHFNSYQIFVAIERRLDLNNDDQCVGFI